MRFRPSRETQMQVEPRPSLTPSLVVPKDTCVETRGFECPPARPAGIHPRFSVNKVEAFQSASQKWNTATRAAIFVPFLTV